MELTERPLRILIADDEDAILALYGQILSRKYAGDRSVTCPGSIDKDLITLAIQSFSFDLSLCHQGTEAVDAVKKSLTENQPFAMAFLDVRMPPGPDGIWVAERIRKLDPNIELVIVTAFSDVDPQDIANRVPPLHKILYLQKPFHPQEIYHFTLALCSKWHMEHTLHAYGEDLERLVTERTSALIDANKKLKQEIINRKQSELDLARSKALFSTAFYTSPISMCISTVSDDMLLLVNNAWLKLMDFNRNEDVIGSIPEDLGCWLNTADREKRNIYLRDIGSFWDQEIQIRTSKGKLRNCIYSAERIQHGGKPCTLSLAIDITERKQAEQALKKSEERFRTLVNLTSDWVWETDKNGCYSYVDPKVKEILGYNPGEVIGKPRNCFMAKEETSRMAMLLEGKNSFNRFRNSQVHKDGREIILETSGMPMFDSEGVLTGWRGLDTDITKHVQAEKERKALEKKIARAEKIEALGTLAGGVAHDLNNVLAGIINYPELLLMQLPEDSPLKGPIYSIQESGERAAAIVQDLLTLSRRGVAVNEAVNLNTVVDKYMNSPEYSKLKTFHPAVKVETDLETDLPNIQGSPVHLSKTIMNLVSNAAEAMPEGGKLSISTKKQYIEKSLSDDGMGTGVYVVLKVSDTGIGISSEDLNRIYEPFYTKKKMGRSGTGLGMAVVWGTVEDHNGHIDVQSVEGKGTTFKLYFPATDEKPLQNKLTLDFSDYAGRGESILVVDDVKEQRDILSQILTELGYSVTAVSSGQEAIEYLKHDLADLLILDMIMESDMDGLDTYREILKINPAQKAIISSGFSETDRVREAKNIGAGYYLRKPYTVEKIGVAIKTELSK